MGLVVGARRRGVSELEKVARNLETKLAGAMKAVAEAMRERAVRCFDQQADPWGRPWALLSGKTVYARLARGTGLSRLGAGQYGPRQRVRNQRRSRVFGRERAIGFDDLNNTVVTTRLTRRAERLLSGGGIKILIDTGTLRGGIATRSDDTSAVIGFGGPHAELAAYHQFGSDDGRLPARPILPIGDDGNPDLPEDLMTEIRETISDALKDDTGRVTVGARTRR